jgi:hypothetical protein
MNETDKYILRRTEILEDEINFLLSVNSEHLIKPYLSYDEENFIDFIIMMLTHKITKEIQIGPEITFKDILLLNNIKETTAEKIKNDYKERIVEYYFGRNVYL